MDGWIAVRLRRRWGLSGTDEYRGLRPSSKLVTTQTGQAFELAFEQRELDSGPDVYRACDSIQQTISRLYLQAGIKQGGIAQRQALPGGQGTGGNRRRRDGAYHTRSFQA